MDTDCFTVHVKLEDVLKDLAKEMSRKDLTPQTANSGDHYP